MIRFFVTIALLVSLFCSAVAQEVLREPSGRDLRPWEGTLYGEVIDEWEVVGDGRYRGEYHIPSKWYDREVVLRLGYVGMPYRLVVNGVECAECDNGLIRSDYNLTKLSREGLNSVEIILDPNSEINRIESWRVGCDSLGLDPIRGAEILAPARMTLSDVHSRMSRIDGGVRCDVSLVLRSYSLNDRTSMVSYSLTTPDGEVLLSGEESVTLGMFGCDTLRLSTVVNGGVLWSGERASLCRLGVKLNYSGWSVEEHDISVGVRSVECDDEGDIYINGRKEILVASVVEVGDLGDESVIRRLQVTGVNTLLLSAGVDSQDILGLCDRMGIYVIYTAPIDSSVSGEAITRGGNPSNDPMWRSRYLSRVGQSYGAVRHHPSVIAFAMAEGSANGCNLYDCYLTMKGMVDDLPIIYRDNRGEWNSDKLKLVIF